MKIFNKFKVAFLQKAYTEGIYSDIPANRKLGRVGMTYSQYFEKINKKEKEENLNPITKEDIIIDNKNSIDIYRKGNVNTLSAENGLDIPILNKKKEIIGYLQKREVGLGSVNLTWNWDFSLGKEKSNDSSSERYETRKEAIDNFVKEYNNTIKEQKYEKGFKY